MLLESIKTDFKRYKDSAANDNLLSVRERAFTEFEKLGFPTTRMEEWKYSNLKPVLEKNFISSERANDAGIQSFLDSTIIKSFKANRLVFVNGKFSKELSTLLETDSRLLMMPLSEAAITHTALVEKHFGKYAPDQDHAMNALNTAMHSDGLFIHVPEGAAFAYPVSVLFISDTEKGDVFNQPRNLVVLEKQTALTLIESYYAIGTGSAFSNIVSEIYVGESASLEHYKLQREAGEHYQNNFTQIFQEANTNINQVTLTLDGAWVRNNLHFYMNGANCNSLLYGLYLTSGKQFVDNHSRVDHAMPNCFSDEKYKGVLMDQSTAVFNGKIIVHKDAQKTNAYQRNQNILLSDEATVNTKPQLEIFADDVKCTHGATTGQLDAEPMFYLRSRGIPEEAARKLLLNAFADDIAEKIKIPELVTLLEEQIDKKL